MNNVNKTLFIPLYGKSKVSKQGIILKDPTAEKIWQEEGFPIRGKSKSKWLAYNMAMRARIFDDWTNEKLLECPDAIVLHIGCGLDSRCQRVKQPYKNWFDCDFPEVISVRKKYFSEKENYHMITLDATDSHQIQKLMAGHTAIVILEGVSMYLSNDKVRNLLKLLQEKYANLHILMDVYTEFAAKASKYKNPVNEVGVTTLYGIDDIESITASLKIHLEKEHSLVPDALVNELSSMEKIFFKLMFAEGIYRKIYRLYELTL